MDYVQDILLQIYDGLLHCLIGIFSIRNFGFFPTESKLSTISRLNPEQRRNKLLKKLFCCLALNGLVFGLGVYAFHFLLLPIIQHISEVIGGKDLAEGVWQFLRPLLLSLFNTLWLVPMFLLSRIVNCIWFQDVADLAFEISEKHKKVKISFTTFVADVICSVAIQTLFLIQSCVVTLFPIPYVGDVLSFFHLCLLYSLYSFEYKWINFGWPLRKRLAFVDYNWPYFFGFGLPLALLTMIFNSYIASICIFSVIFPLYIISAINSTPVLCKFNCRFHIFVPVLYCWNFCTRTAAQRSVIKRN